MQLFRAQAEWGPSWTPIHTSWSVEGEFQGTMSEGYLAEIMLPICSLVTDGCFIR